MARRLQWGLRGPLIPLFDPNRLQIACRHRGRREPPRCRPHMPPASLMPIRISLTENL
jgi:hypothetical protein